MQAYAQGKVVHMSTGILLEYCWNTISNNKNEQTVNTQNMCESQKHYADRKKANHERVHAIHMIFI